MGIRYLIVFSVPACKRAGRVVPILLDGFWIVVNALLVVYSVVCVQVAPVLVKMPGQHMGRHVSNLDVHWVRWWLNQLI